MANLRTSFTLDLGGNLITRAKAFSTSISGMARQIRSSLGGLNGVAAQAGKGLEALTGRYATGIAGLGVSYKAAQAVMDSARLDKGLMRTSQTMGLTAQQAEETRRALFAMSRDTGQSVDDLKAGFDRLGASGMSYEQALASIRAINPAMAVTGASADQLASALSVAGEIFKFDLSRPETAVRLLDQMTAAGRLGNAELEDLSSIFARVGGSAKNAGLSFGESLAFIEQLSLIEKEPERLATLADSTLRLFTNQNYLKEAADATGVKFYDAKGERRAAFDVLQDIARKYQQFKTDAQRDKAFAQAFGKTDLDTQRGLRALFDSGVLVNLAKLNAEIEGASGTIARDLPNAINNSVDQVGRLKAALSQAADDFARPFNEAIAGGIAMLLDGEGLSGKQLLGGAAAAGVAGYGALKLAGLGLSRLGGKAAGGLVSTVARQAGLAGLKLPLPVYVVNKQMSLTREAMLGQSGGAPAAPGAPGGKKAGKGKTVSGAQLDGAKSAGRGAALLSAAATVAPALLDPDTTMAQKVDVATDAAGGLAGGWAGAAAGAKAGAFLGGFLGPFGAAAGGVVGGVAGGLLGSELGQGLVSTVKDWLGFGEGENPALQKTMQDFLSSMQQIVASIPTGGIAVDVNVTGNAQAAIKSSNGNIDSGLAYSRQIANEMME
ncbi:phage tail tape measure protein [uncultured Desulfovibrio sp.]|uniref:phage tail tape measure protein n=1 Tax=uncultured Desulfovibrio sp. TaxID=167968 RepID=UPI0026053CD5|nr:phage tail tape measure protein [uncultured Desulfovibrio sp.]